MVKVASDARCVNESCGDFERAIQDYNEAIRLNPHEYWFYLNRGNALFLLVAGFIADAAGGAFYLLDFGVMLTMLGLSLGWQKLRRRRG